MDEGKGRREQTDALARLGLPNRAGSGDILSIRTPRGKNVIPRVVQHTAFRMTVRKQVVPFPAAMICFALERQMTNQFLVQPRDVALFQVGLPRDDLGIILVEPGLISLVDSEIALIDGFAFFLGRDAAIARWPRCAIGQSERR